MKFKKIIEAKEIKNQKDLVDEMDLDVKTAEEKAKEDIETNKKIFKDALKQCSLVEGYNYINNENNYTVNIKNRAELAKLIESLKQNNIKHRISRSKLEGYRYDVTFKYELNEDVEKTEVKKITTPRGTFEVVDKTEDELRKDGYGYHHSGNGYKIFVKNNQAVAIKECNLKENNINQTTRKISKQKGNNTPITDEDQKKEWEAEDENNWNESLKEGSLRYSTLKKGDKVKLDKEKMNLDKIQDKSLLDDTYEVVGFWYNQELVDDDMAPEHVRDLSGLRIKNDRTGKEYDINRFQLTSIDESLKESYDDITLTRDGEKDDYYIIIEGTRNGYSIGQVENNTITVEELIDYLEQFDSNTKVVIGNDWQRGDYYTYGSINESTIRECYIENKEVDEEDDDLEEESLKESKLNEIRKASKQRKLSESEIKQLAKSSKNLKEDYDLNDLLHSKYYIISRSEFVDFIPNIAFEGTLLQCKAELFDIATRTLRRSSETNIIKMNENFLEFKAYGKKETYEIVKNLPQDFKESLKEGYYDYMDKDYTDILDQNVDVYDLDKFISDNTDDEYEPHYMHKAAIIIAPNGKGTIVDYEAIGNDFDSIESDVKIPLHKKEQKTVEKDGKITKTFSLVPTHSVEVPVQDIINEAPKETMTYREFFNKYKYNDRCSKNFRELIAHLKKNGMFENDKNDSKNESFLTTGRLETEEDRLLDNILYYLRNHMTDDEVYDFLIKCNWTPEQIDKLELDIEKNIKECNLTEKKTRQPKWRYNGNAEKSAEFIANGTNLAGQPCCEDYENEDDERRFLNKESLKLKESNANDFIQALKDLKEEHIYEFADYSGLDTIENEREADIEYGTDGYDDYIDTLRNEVCAYYDEEFDNLTHTIVSKVDACVNKRMSYFEIINFLIKDAEAELNESLKESKEDEVIEDDNVEEISLDDIDIEGFDDVELDNISVDDIVDEDEEALNILKDKLDIEVVEDEDSSVLSIKPKEFDTKKAPELKVEVEQEEAEKINNTFNKEEEKVEDNNLPEVDKDEDNVNFDEITDAEKVDAKQALAGLKKISVSDKKEDNKEEKEVPAEEEVVEIEEDDDDTSFLDKIA